MSDDDRLAQIDAVLPGRWDREALRAGASVCVALAVPFRILAAVVGGDSGGLNALFFVCFVALFVVGAGSAAWIQRTGTPMSHALVTALVTYLVVEAVFIVVRFVRGTDIPWFGIFFTLSVVMLAGLVGGLLGNRLQTQGLRPTGRR